MSVNTRRFFISMVGVIVLGFQNCTGFVSAPSGQSSESSLDLPFDHPTTPVSVTGAVATGNILIGDRDFLESVFIDVFDSPTASQNVRGYINAVLIQEFGPTQQMLGRSCDPLEQGTLYHCSGQISNVDIAMVPTSSAIREAARVQVCRRLIANDDVLANVLAKIQGRQSTPNEASVTAAIQLFYPAQESALQVGDKLLQMDEVMAENVETVKNRWRLILLTLCEAPTWQIL